MKRTATLLAATLLFTLALMLGPVTAQEVPPHDHMLTVPGTGEEVQIGPPRCALGPRIDRAFLNVHFNVHLGQPPLTIEPNFC